jgi:tetratricopeptide (TPR) repeat protein
MNWRGTISGNLPSARLGWACALRVRTSAALALSALLLFLQASGSQLNRSPAEVIESARQVLSSGPSQLILERTRRDLYDIVGKNPEAEFWIGRCSLELMKLDEAIASFRAYVKFREKDMDGWDSLVEAYLRARQYDAALATVDSQLKIDPNHAWALAHRGQAFEGQDRCPAAVTAYEEAAKKSKGFFVALIGLGTCYNKLGRHSDALAKFKEAVEAKRDKADEAVIYVGQGEAHEGLGQLEDAVKMYTYARKLNPSDLPTMRRLANSYGRLGRWSDQIEIITALIQKGEKGPDVLDALENACSKDNRLGEWGRILQQLLQTDDSNVQIFIRLGRVRFAEGNYGEAQKFYERVLRQDPNQAEALHRMGEAVERQGGDPARATDYYHKACNAQPQSEDICIDLVRSYLDRGEAPAAEKEIARIRGLGGNSADLQFQAARLEFIQGRFAEALKAVDAAIAANPKVAGAAALRARILARTGPADSAAGELEAAIRLSPKEQILYVELADVYQQMEKWTDLQDLEKRYLALWPKEPEAMMYLAFACQQTGDASCALQYYRTALDLSWAAEGSSRRAWVYNNYGVLLLAAPDYPAAIKNLTEAQAINPAEPGIVQNLGLALAEQGSIKEAEIQLKRLQEMGSPLAEKFAAYLDAQRRKRRSP